MDKLEVGDKVEVTLHKEDAFMDKFGTKYTGIVSQINADNTVDVDGRYFLQLGLNNIRKIK